MSRYALDQIEKLAKEIAQLEKSPGHQEASHAYAHALGKANGLAKLILALTAAEKGAAK